MVQIDMEQSDDTLETVFVTGSKRLLACNVENVGLF